MRKIRKQSALILLLGLISLFYFSANTFAEENQGLILAEQLQNLFVSLVEQVKASVVAVEPIQDLSQPQKEKSPQDLPGEPDKPPDQDKGGNGSGVITSPDGYIISNYHVVGINDEMKIILSDKREFIAKVIGRDPDTDLALMKIETAEKLSFASLGNSDNVKVGQFVLAVGKPFGLTGTITFGIVSALNRNNINLNKYEDFIQTDAAINPGNSGGPSFNIKGEVIGINTAIINMANGIGFVIPANMVKEIIQQLKETGKVSRGYLGVGIQNLTPKLAEKFNWNNVKGGVLISETFDGQPADKAGLKPGDIILKVESSLVESGAQLSRIIAGFKPGKMISIEIAREGIIMSFSVILAGRESADKN